MKVPLNLNVDAVGLLGVELGLEEGVGEALLLGVADGFSEVTTIVALFPLIFLLAEVLSNETFLVTIAVMPNLFSSLATANARLVANFLCRVRLLTLGANPVTVILAAPLRGVFH